MSRLKLNPKDPLAEHWSSWLVTINTNSTDKKLVGPLKTIWAYITKNMVNFTFSKYPGTTYVEVGQKGNVEIGDEMHRVHFHGQVITKSNGIVYLDYKKIKDFVDKQLARFDTFTGSHLDCQLVKNFNASVAIQRYISKAPIETDEDETEFEIIL